MVTGTKVATTNSCLQPIPRRTKRNEALRSRHGNSPTKDACANKVTSGYKTYGETRDARDKTTRDQDLTTFKENKLEGEKLR
jgi:hypothetical protein